MSAFLILIHAHDYVWARKEIPLRERIDTCDLLWRAAIAEHTRSWR